MSEAFYTATTDDAKSWLDGGDEFLPPESILNDLTEDQVRTAPAGCPYSIAQIVAHMHYWQGGSLAKLRGQEWKRPAHLEDTFAPPAAGTWESLRTAFLADLNTIRALADTQREYGYVSRALHNGYHLGQIVLLRRILGLWPPAGGEAYDF